MTGYGKSQAELPGKKVTVELRSVNSKQLDLGMRVPGPLRGRETELRQMVSARVGRGKVDLSMLLEQSDAGVAASHIDHALAKRYCDELRALAAELGLEQTAPDLHTLLALPDVVKTAPQEMDEEEWLAVRAAVERALDDFDDFRRQEGASLANDLLTRVGLIEQYHAQVPPFEKGRVDKIRERLEANLNDTVGRDRVDANRFEQELIYYLEKLDINEEKVRLTNHIAYFRETLRDEAAPGRKLAFIAQEMGREINTMGSKSNQADMQRLVVQMKDELEKIKEQVLNVL